MTLATKAMRLSRTLDAGGPPSAWQDLRVAGPQQVAR